ncbi:MAG: hypothetical protein KDM81_04135 [Verrucomicrobiae bacterium]|nr:hypothetical protein [Verrucomicrobiae bacterium]MCP5523673.1 hypothetical protein [Verrucomicrobiales bacterium]
MKKLLFALVAGGVLAVTSMQVAQAQVVSFTFLAKVVGSDWDGEFGFGSFSYDKSTITGLGDEWVVPANALHTDLLFLGLSGQSFDETDDSGYPAFPIIGLTNGKPVAISWWIEEPSTKIKEPGLEAILIDGPLVWYEPIGSKTGEGFFVVQTTLVGSMPVPEPSSIAFSVVAGLGLGTFLVRRRRMAKAAQSA